MNIRLFFNTSFYRSLNCSFSVTPAYIHFFITLPVSVDEDDISAHLLKILTFRSQNILHEKLSFQISCKGSVFCKHMCSSTGGFTAGANHTVSFSYLDVLTGVFGTS